MIEWTGEATPGTPYWWEGASWPVLNEAMPISADLVVVGGGYTGLSGAIAAHDAGARVVVLDAGQPGRGASTRNGGMVGAHPKLSWHEICDAFGEETADGIYAEAPVALAFVRDLIAREGIDCDFSECGRIQLAWTKAHLAKQETLAKSIREKSKVPCETRTRGEIDEDIRTNLYFGGILFPDHASLHPRKYHDGLLRACLNRGIRVLADTAVRALEREATGFRIRTATGDIRAGRVLMATNGYTGSPFRWLARRVFPVPSFLIATEPLSRNLISSLAPGRRMMVETRATRSYFRVSPDGSRILFGGRAAIVNVPLKAAARRLHATMAEIWPELRDTRLSHVWTGNTGFSFSHLPCTGEDRGLHYAVGFSGSGTVLAPYLGAKAGWQAIGDARGATAYQNTSLRTKWFHRGGAPHFLRPADIWYRHWVDRSERRAAQADRHG